MSAKSGTSFGCAIRRGGTTSTFGTETKIIRIRNKEKVVVKRKPSGRVMRVSNLWEHCSEEML